MLQDCIFIQVILYLCLYHAINYVPNIILFFIVTSYSPFQSLIFQKYIYVVLCLINSKLYRIQLLSTSKLTSNFLKCIMIIFVLENVVKYGILYPYFTDACHPSHPGNPFEILVILNVF